MCGCLGFLLQLTGFALVVLVILHPIGWLVLVGILLISGTAGVSAFIKSLMNLGKRD